MCYVSSFKSPYLHIYRFHYITFIRFPQNLRFFFSHLFIAIFTFFQFLITIADGSSVCSLLPPSLHKQAFLLSNSHMFFQWEIYFGIFTIDLRKNVLAFRLPQFSNGTEWEEVTWKEKYFHCKRKRSIGSPTNFDVSMVLSVVEFHIHSPTSQCGAYKMLSSTLTAYSKRLILRGRKKERKKLPFKSDSYGMVAKKNRTNLFSISAFLFHSIILF